MKGTKKIFVDTNILVYAYDRDAGLKRDKAQKIMTALWNQHIMPSISIQVLQELYVNLRKKNVPIHEAGEIIKDYLSWNVIENTVYILTAGIHLSQQYCVSFWDALIIAAAQQSGANLLYSEDLNDGQIYGSVKVINPLKNHSVA
ncbi:PIN domain-containing protein [candidate division CSSED10-310 bacterium]|uniref:PIN domain-containing protein n=1 Tax=candidate division CSSED10-310 bacterium TaxID=2855610 RepID=A0ABV6Z1Z7_UNCC1